MDIVRRECFSDDDYNYEVLYLNTGTVVRNRHPKVPERDKDIVIREVGALMYNAWRGLMGGGCGR
ncbi:MAG: hypothetical protein IJH37_05105 [Clostridia bacterium]|nr:hypothetical protein [Clostridia bacterium]